MGAEATTRNGVAELRWTRPSARASDGEFEPELGYLSVPRSWASPHDGERFELPVARYRRRGSQHGMRPTVLLLAGGPGDSGIAEAARGSHRPVLERLHAEADVIAFEQRGALGARPALSSVTAWGLPIGTAVSRETVLEHARALARRSVKSWGTEGLDVRQFDTHLTALDIRALIDAMELDRVSLFGASYGTQLGLNVLRENPNRVRRCVFVNVEALHQTVKLPAQIDSILRCILRATGRDGDASHERLWDLLRRLDHSPQWALVDGIEVAVGGFELRRVIAKHIGQPYFALQLSASIRAWSGGDLHAVAREIVAWKEGPFGGLQHVVDAASGISPARARQVEIERSETCLGDAVDFPLPAVGVDYGVDDLGEDYRAGVSSEVPVLFISGDLDARTPPTNVEEILPAFPNAVHHVKSRAMHDLGDYTADRTLLDRLHDWLVA